MIIPPHRARWTKGATGLVVQKVYEYQIFLIEGMFFVRVMLELKHSDLESSP
jgi:hypothetical protein